MSKLEKRQERRVSAEMPLNYRILNGEGELAGNHRGKTTSVSLSGVAFLSDLNIPIDSRVDLEMKLPGNSGKLRSEAKVARIIHERAENGGIEYAVRFDEDTLEDPQGLERFVRSIDIVPLLKHMIKLGATDLHLTADSTLVFRVDRKLVKPAKPMLSKEAVESLISATLTAERAQQLADKKETYFPFVVPELGRWRVSVFRQRGNLEATFHAIDLHAPTLSELGLPNEVHQLAMLDSGLILMTGSAGSGKGATAAAVIDAINRQKEKIVITLEDPIQYVHCNDRSVVKQREIGADADSIEEGMKNILRQDADVVLLDDVPSAAVMDMALRAAESGVLVIACFPTSDAVATVKRIVGMYPEERRTQMLRTLVRSLQGVISQRKLPSLDGRAMVVIPEVMTVSEGIRQAIWTNTLEQIPNLMAVSSECVTLDTSLRNALDRGLIDYEHASHIARDAVGLRRNAVV